MQYKDPLFPKGQTLMGYKGDSYMDSGYFGISPITGNFTYWPPIQNTLPQGTIVSTNKKLEFGFKSSKEYRSIDEPFEVSKEKKNE